jgi:hypothetical protein
VNQRDTFHVSLFDLLQERAALRRQQLALEGTFAAVQRELRNWNDHCGAERAAGRPLGRDLGAHLEELQSRERELAIELCRVRQDVLGIHTSIDRLLQHKPRIAQPAVVPQAAPALKAPSNLSAARPLPRAV